MRTLAHKVSGIWATVNGAILFYTRIPLPHRWPAKFARIALIVPWVGVGLGVLLSGLDRLMGTLGLSLELGSALVVLTGVWLTGGLHLDGAMDTGDGLAVQDDQQRLVAMADSRTGAFGVMVGVAILLLKTIAFAGITHHRWFALISATAWGRWGQQWAIGRYAYLKPEGKGAFHKQAIPSCWQALPAALGLVGLTGIAMTLGWIRWPSGLMAVGLGLGHAYVLAGWLNRRIGGHTGDTYGAMVEWGEVAVLVGLAAVN
ncbi:adenosylcobinamide-GDP ribazoletransferase [Leptothoe kymatousa]|uniref:Adenosylcobinamide-GDP ribazoletransferase n=1 Tax=Leptothoe kymatousa TAU-MAC 1615 TaxID=2364775 RepID=A0ABS5Y7H1_9CYAN|nr:adenosylcobinamide-GDP ribazoletransferase [Leptothoe kymatousa]MBT9313762.1 adenosylcobinamide-GDP ribazoletransferase [Leptothoe kymatousa TAU-MAC 1615]